MGRQQVESSIWNEFEKSFDYSNPLDQNAARRYPKLFSNRGWSALVNSSKVPKKTDSGWLLEVLEGHEERIEQARESKKRTIRRVIRAIDAQPKSHMRASEWVRFIKSVNITNPFDPRTSEWTGLEIIRLIVRQFLEINAKSSDLELIHPDNVLIPNKWRLEELMPSSMSWEGWRDFVKSNQDIRIINQEMAIYDYRYRDNEKSLTGSTAWESQLHSIGRLLWGLLRNEFIVPPIWNIRGNEYARAFSVGSSFLHLAVSNSTLRILEGCLDGRSAENRAIKVQPSLFGWNEGEEPNDAKLDPPLLFDPNELYSAIQRAQEILVENPDCSINEPTTSTYTRSTGKHGSC